MILYNVIVSDKIDPVCSIKSYQNKVEALEEVNRLYSKVCKDEESGNVEREDGLVSFFKLEAAGGHFVQVQIKESNLLLDD